MPDPIYKCWALLRCLCWCEQGESFVLPQPKPWEHPGKMSSVCPGSCDAAVFGMAWHVTHLLGIQRVFERSVEKSESPGYPIILRLHKSMLLLKGVEGNGSDKNPTFLLWQSLALPHHPGIICHMATQTVLPAQHVGGHTAKQ